MTVFALDAPCSSTGTEGTPAPSAPVMRPESITPTLTVTVAACHPPFDMKDTVPVKVPKLDAVNSRTAGMPSPALRSNAVPARRRNGDDDVVLRAAEPFSGPVRCFAP